MHDNDRDVHPAPAQAPDASASTAHPLLERLFAQSWRASQAPESLRDWLGVTSWQAMDAPDGVDVAAVLRASAWRLASGHAPTLTRPPAHWRVRHWRPDADGADALDLDDAAPVDVHVFHLDRERCAFARPQWPVLRHWRQRQRDQQARCAESQRRIDVLGGAGTLAELLALTVYVDDPTLPAREHQRMQVVPIYSEAAAGLQPLPLREVYAALAQRVDYDGIVVNPGPYLQRVISPLKDLYWGPMLAARALAGMDERRTECTLGASLQRLCHEQHNQLPGFAARVDHSLRQRAAEVLALAVQLLAPLSADHPRWARADCHSANAAALLRHHPEVGDACWLQGVANRCQRIVQTRWRVGLY